ncbi:peroxidase skpo-1-like [Spodoptera frugiperda]|uniref:Peroxidase skpo-1-like n=1 Tax=Spodoptera frugiperda TaxID=7108 RepID=A0A9R0E2W9_SPOFR|nr:peroxidase skpo-1-like [Spodoptera frugiperda]
MLVTGLFFLYFCANLSGAAVYDIFTGETLSDEQLSTYQDANLTEICTVNITSCDTEELRRVDGSCNNINRPAKGISLAPPIRIVLPVFDNGYKPRRAVSGNSLPVSRDIGQIILSGYKRNDCNFTQLMTSFGMFMFWDVGALNNSREF